MGILTLAMPVLLLSAVASAPALLFSAVASASEPGTVTFSAVATPVEVGRPFEVVVTVEAPTVADCHTEARVAGEVTHEADSDAVQVVGSCDSEDGSVFRVVFTPERPGEHHWRVVYRQGDFERAGGGSFTAVRPAPGDDHRRR